MPVSCLFIVVLIEYCQLTRRKHKLATTVYTEYVYNLSDGKEVTLKPLNIGRLKALMAVWKEFENLEKEEDSFDIFINCAGIALEHEYKEDYPEGTRGKGKEVLSRPYKEYLEEVLDMDTIYKIMEVCAGMKLNDPNLLAAAARVAEDGTR